MGFKNMKRDDHGHVISNDETDGQKCQHASGQADKVEDQKYNKEMKEAQEQNAAMSESFDDDYDEEFEDDPAGHALDAVESELHINVLDSKEDLDDAKRWLVANGYAKSHMEAQDLIESALSDEGKAKLNKLLGFDEDDEFEDESQEEYEARIKPEVDKFKKQLDDAGYKLKENEYGIEKADKNNIKLLEGDKFSIDGRDFEITRIDRNGQHIVAKDDTGTEFDWTRDALLNDKSFKNADNDVLDGSQGLDKLGISQGFGKRVSKNQFEEYVKLSDEDKQKLRKQGFLQNYHGYDIEEVDGKDEYRIWKLGK